MAENNEENHMVNAESFSTMLSDIGLTTAAQRNVLIAQNINTYEALSQISDKELKAIFDDNHIMNRRRNLNQQVIIPIPIRTMIEGLRYDMELRSLCDQQMTSQYVEEGFDTQYLRYLAQQKSDHVEGRENISNVPTPEVPKLTRMNWRTWRDSFIELLGSMVGAFNISLKYVVRPANDPLDYDGNYATVEDKLSKCLSLNGNRYSSDNDQVYSLLSVHLDGTPGEPFAQRTRRQRNGRACWTALRLHYESDSYLQNLRTEALKMISKSEYTGPKKNFDLASLYNIHVSAHNMLAESGMPYSDTQKITAFQQRLREPLAINFSVNALSKLENNPSFQAYFNVLWGDLNQVITLSNAASSGNNRSISQLHTGGRRGGRGGRGRGGRGRARGGRHGNRSGGRGRGRGRSHGRGGRYNNHYHPYSNNNSNWQPRLGHIPDDEWNNYQDWQVQAVLELRQQHNSSSQRGNYDNRSINQLGVDDQSVPSQITNHQRTDNDTRTAASAAETNASNSQASRGRAGAAFNQQH